MKNPIVIAFISILFFTSINANAQEIRKDSTIKYYNSHIFTIAPFGFINKVRIRYEFANSKQTTFGVQSSYYYDKIFPGVQIVGNIRQYISERHAPFGLYLMGQAGFAYHRATSIEGIKYNSGSGFLSWGSYSHSKSYEVKSFGGTLGGGLGYQLGIGRRKRLVLDMYLGFKVFVMNKNLDDINVEYKKAGLPTFDLGGSPYKNDQFSKDGDGIGGLLNSGINIGYRF
jgi:hypothetical protein